MTDWSVLEYKKMKRMFLDPHRPLYTCAATDCVNCPVQGRLHCHFNGKDLAQFLLIAFPPFIAGGVGIAHVNGWLLLPWVGLILGFFGFIEIRVMCSHCPHYAEPGTKTLQCWANYGSPKLWKYRPGPMTPNETFIFFAGIALVAAFPLTVLVFSAQGLLLAIFAALVVVMGFAMRYKLCSQCMNFACPFNQVPPKARMMFFARNPGVAEAWKEYRAKHS
jgi:hypothetical protein